MASQLQMCVAFLVAYVMGISTGWLSGKGWGTQPWATSPTSPKTDAAAECPPCVCNCFCGSEKPNAPEPEPTEDTEREQPAEGSTTSVTTCPELPPSELLTDPALGGEPLPHRAVVRQHLAKHSFDELWSQIGLWTMVKKEKVKFMWDAVLRVNALGLEGDILEAGVWKGGCSMAMILANLVNNTDRHFWLFDTFEGLPKPGPKDDSRSHKIWQQIQQGTYDRKGQKKRFVEEGKFNYGPKEVVKNNLFWTGYPWEKFHLVQGKVEKTLPSLPGTELPSKFVVLRLDTDWYQSTQVELEYLWDRLVPGGLLYIDDYCSWGGARTATQEFFEKKLRLDVRKFSERKPCLYYWKPEK